MADPSAILERAILYELRIVEKNPKLRNKDIQEWALGSGTVKPHEGEKLVEVKLSEFDGQPASVSYKAVTP